MLDVKITKSTQWSPTQKMSHRTPRSDVRCDLKRDEITKTKQTRNICFEGVASSTTFDDQFQHPWQYNSFPVLLCRGSIIVTAFSLASQPAPVGSQTIYSHLRCAGNLRIRKVRPRYGFPDGQASLASVSSDNTIEMLSININPEKIICGVPQGSVLGPLLFILFINDIVNVSTIFKLMFGDDTNIFASHKNADKLI